MYVISGARIEVCNLQGTVKHTIGFTDAEGDPSTLDIMGNFLCVSTAKQIIKLWDIARREPRQHNAGKAFVDEATGKAIGTIASARVNPTGTCVSILATRMAGGSPIPDTRVHVWHCELDKISAYDFVDKRPTLHFWDPMEPKLLGCETLPVKRTTDSGGGGGAGGGSTASDGDP